MESLTNFNQKITYDLSSKVMSIYLKMYTVFLKCGKYELDQDVGLPEYAIDFEKRRTMQETFCAK